MGGTQRADALQRRSIARPLGVVEHIDERPGVALVAAAAGARAPPAVVGEHRGEHLVRHRPQRIVAGEGALCSTASRRTTRVRRASRSRGARAGAPTPRRCCPGSARPRSAPRPACRRSCACRRRAPRCRAPPNASRCSREMRGDPYRCAPRPRARPWPAPPRSRLCAPRAAPSQAASQRLHLGSPLT